MNQQYMLLPGKIRPKDKPRCLALIRAAIAADPRQVAELIYRELRWARKRNHQHYKHAMHRLRCIATGRRVAWVNDVDPKKRVPSAPITRDVDET